MSGATVGKSRISLPLSRQRKRRLSWRKRRWRWRTGEPFNRENGMREKKLSAAEHGRLRIGMRRWPRPGRQGRIVKRCVWIVRAVCRRQFAVRTEVVVYTPFNYSVRGCWVNVWSKLKQILTMSFKIDHRLLCKY